MTAQSPTSTALAVPSDSHSLMSAPGDFGPEHMRIVRDAFAPTASQAEFEVMWAGAKARRLDPVRKQIHFVKRKSRRDGQWVEQWTSIVAIDGFRAIAEGTGKYDGQDEPEYEYADDGRLLLARVRIYRRDISRAFVGVARWNEYVQTNQDGTPSATWGKMEHTMLAKCAEALGLRKAFPEPLAGIYTGDEMAQADNVAPLAAQWARAEHPAPPPAKALAQGGRQESRGASPPQPRVSDQVIDARSRWSDPDDGGDIGTEQALAASPDPRDRALVYKWRIAGSETDAEFTAIEADLAADMHPGLKADMLRLVGERRAETGKQGGVA